MCPGGESDFRILDEYIGTFELTELSVTGVHVCPSGESVFCAIDFII